MNKTYRADVRRGWSWIVQAQRLLRTDPGLWLGMALLYVVVATVLKLIPFMGVLLVVLITPTVLAGAMRTADSLHELIRQSPGERAARAVEPPPRLKGNWTRPDRLIAGELKRAARQLLCGFADERRIMPVMVISTLTLGAVVILFIVALLLNPWTALSAMLAGSVGARIGVTAVVGLLVLVALAVLLFMGVLYTVPLILFQNDHPLPAIEHSFVTCRHHAVALLTFSAPFLAGLAGGRALFFALSFPYDYIIATLFAVLLLPLFVVGLYYSYRDLLSVSQK